MSRSYFNNSRSESFSTYSSAITGISLFIRGRTTVLPIRCLYLSSSGCTATAVSPSMVSGLVVATTTNSSLSLTGYFICQKWPAFSSYSTSASDMEVLHFGHQFIILSPLYIRPFCKALRKPQLQPWKVLHPWWIFPSASHRSIQAF